MSSKIKKKKVIESRCFCGLRNRFVVSFLRILIDFSMRIMEISPLFERELFSINLFTRAIKRSFKHLIVKYQFDRIN